MAGLRCFHPEGNFNVGGSIILGAAHSHHLIKVLRAKQGERIEVIDGQGQRAVVDLEKANPKAAVLHVKSVETFTRPAVQVELVQAVPKNKVMDAIIQKATELGIARIQPLLTERTELKLEPDRLKKKQQHWLDTAIEACKQSGNPFLPEIQEPIKLPKFFQQMAEQTEKHMCIVGSLETGAQPLYTELQSIPQELKKVTVLIGPEGDLSSKEYALARERGFVPVSLGNLVLKCETAVLYILSVVDAHLRGR